MKWSWMTVLLAALSICLVLILLWDRRRPASIPLGNEIFESGTPHFLFLGTSLTEGQAWPDVLIQKLESCGVIAASQRLSGNGKTSSWGVKTLRAAQNSDLRAPDLAVIEFSVNDADFRRFLSPAQSAANTKLLISMLRKMNPEVQIVLLGMYPGFGIRGALRLRYGAYLTELERIAAKDERIGYLDMAKEWQITLHEAPRTKMPDGLHPTSEIASQVNADSILNYFALSQSLRCER
ncbi:SGNH/GDSL hydrolase family protein [Donghicola tyrosinivorans]|nr:SGNH/GDSL hydrolase family protein [Donghicola tyrosinivorans]